LGDPENTRETKRTKVKVERGGRGSVVLNSKKGGLGGAVPTEKDDAMGFTTFHRSDGGGKKKTFTVGEGR